MRMQAVFSGTGSFEGTKQSTLRNIEGAGFDISAVDRGFDVGVILGLADLHGELTEVQLHALVAGDVADVQFSGEHVNIERTRLLHFDGEPEIVAGAVGDFDVGPITVGVEENLDVGFAIVGDANRVIAPDQFDPAGTEVHVNSAARAKGDCDRTLAYFLDAAAGGLSRNKDRA